MICYKNNLQNAQTQRLINYSRFMATVAGSLLLRCALGLSWLL